MNPSNNKTYTSLEPSYFQSLGEKGVAPTFSTGDAVSLFSSTSFLYSLAIMLSVLAAGVMYARAGIWRMEASERGVRRSNDEIKRVTLGLLGVLSLFVILYTFNKDLLSGNVGLDGLRATAGKSGGGGSFGGGGATGDFSTPPTPTDGSEEQNRRALKNLGITVISTSGQTTPCTTAQLQQAKPACTNLTGIPSSVISMLTQLRSSCSGNIKVTGGTEPGHKSHGPGKAAVDVDDDDSQLNTCIRKFPTGPSLSWCNATFIGLGFVFCDEKGTSHWHIFK